MILRISADAGRDGPRGTVAGGGGGFISPDRISFLTALFAAEVVAASASRLPNEMFLRFVAMDSGAELAIQDMISRGSRPGVDFGYPYGLLPLLIGRAWYGLAGSTPRSFHVLVTGYMSLSCWGLA